MIGGVCRSLTAPGEDADQQFQPRLEIGSQLDGPQSGGPCRCANYRRPGPVGSVSRAGTLGMGRPSVDTNAENY